MVGRPAIKALNLVVQVEPVLTEKETIMSKFPTLIKGLGRMEGTYRIELCDNAKPFTLTAPRRIAIPLLPKV